MAAAKVVNGGVQTVS